MSLILQNKKERSFMNSINRTLRDRDAYVENLAAELTDAAYPVALRHGVAGSSIDLELDLWKALREKLRRNAYVPYK